MAPILAVQTGTTDDRASVPQYPLHQENRRSIHGIAGGSVPANCLGNLI